MPEETLKVYVSSTWLDLELERAAVSEVTNRLDGLKFLGMEFFGSRDDGTAQTSVAEVDRADLYVGIIGNRYGSGITEREYLRAHERGVPAFIYLKDAPAANDTQALEDSEAQRRLVAFRSRLLNAHTCSNFASPEHLALRLASDLHNWMFKRHLAHGLSHLSTDYLARVQAFIAEYTGDQHRQVPFGGRSEELSKLDQWLSDPNAPPFLLVAAGAGKGKSALLVRWAHAVLARPDVIPVFFPISIRFRTNLASVVFPCLATSIAVLHGEQLKITPDTPSEVWRGLMTDLLSRPLGDGRRLLLIVDGLDEAADWAAGADLFPPHIGRHARVVVAARFLAGDTDARDWFRRLGWDGNNAACGLAVPALAVEAVGDVLKHTAFPLAALGERDDIIYELHRLSQGEPLIVRLYIEDLQRRGADSAQVQVKDLRGIEPGLDGFFARWWDDQRRLWGTSRPLQERRVQVLMNVLSCALGPLTRDDLVALASPLVEMSSWALQEALEPLQRFIVGDGVESGYVYSHPGLGIHFRERLSRKERDEVDTLIRTWCAECVHAVTEGRIAPRELSGYVVQYFGAHLERIAGDLSRFAPLLTDAWRRAWHVRDGSYAGYRADLHRVQQAATPSAPHLCHPSDSLEIVVRTALCSVSVDQLSQNTPPELVVGLMQKDVWSRAAALGFARLIRDPARRAKALIRLAMVAADQLDTQVFHEALEATALVEDSARVPLLARLAPLIPASLVTNALDLALSIDQRSLMADGVIALTSRLLPSHVERVLEVFRRVNDSETRRRVFAALAIRHPEVLSSWARTNDRSDPAERAWVLFSASEGMPPAARSGVLHQAAELARTEGNETVRLDLLLAIAQRLDRIERDGCRAKAELTLQRITYPQTRALAFVRLARMREPTDADSDIAQALRECANIRLESARADAIVDIAWQLQGSHSDALFAIVQTIDDEEAKARAAVALLPQLNEGRREEALRLILAVSDPFERLCALARIADKVPADVLLNQASFLASDDVAVSPIWQFQLLQMLAPALRPRIADLLSTVPHSNDLHVLAQCAALAAFCPPDLRAQVDERLLRVVESGKGYQFAGDLATEALQFLEQWASDATEQSLMAVTEAILNWQSIQPRIAAIDTLSPFMPASLLEYAVRRLQTIGDESSRRQLERQCLALIAPTVVIGRFARIWERTAASERVFQMLRWLERNQVDRAFVRNDILRALPAIENDSLRAGAIVAFAKQVGSTMSQRELTVLVDIALSLRDSLPRANAMSWLLPHLKNEPLPRFEEMLAAIVVDSDEAASLAADLATRVSPRRFRRVFAQLCCVELEGADWNWYEHAPRLLGLTRLSTRLKEPNRSAASRTFIAAIRALDDERKYQVLIQLARASTPDPILAESCFNVVGSLSAALRARAALHFLARLDAAVIDDALRQTIAWIEELATAEERLATVSDVFQGLPYDVASSGAWRAAIVFDCLQRLNRTQAVMWSELAFDDLQTVEPGPEISTACASLLPVVSDDLSDALLQLGLKGLRGASNTPSLARLLGDLAEHAPTGSLQLVVDECARLIERVAHEPNSDNSVASVLRIVLPRLSAVQASRLWQTARQRHRMSSALLKPFLEHLAEASLRSDGSAIAKLLTRLDDGERSSVLRIWTNRLTPSSAQQFLTDINKTQDTRTIALAFLFALPHLFGRYSREKKLAAVAAKALEWADRFEWADLVHLQTILGDRSWPQLEAALWAAIERERSLPASLEKAAEIVPLIVSVTRAHIISHVFSMISRSFPEATLVGDLELRFRPDEIAAVLKSIAQAWPSAAAVYTVLLPLAQPSQCQTLIDAIIRSENWIEDPQVFETVLPYAKRPQIATVLAERISNRDVVESLALLSDPILQLWSHVPSDSPAWHLILRQLVVGASTRSRSHLLNVLQHAAPTIQRALGDDMVGRIVDSVEEVAEWWP